LFDQYAILRQSELFSLRNKNGIGTIRTNQELFVRGADRAEVARIARLLAPAHMIGAMTTLFETQAPRPLADRLRPKSLGEIVGQDHLLGAAGPIGRMVKSRRLSSMILWGPPGCGKTTIARLLAGATDLDFAPLSAVFSGVADLKKVFEAARKTRETGRGTLLFIDEVHRFNRAQQDAFLPHVEDGTVILVGATTENPSFELIGALLSRAQVFVLRRLAEDDLEILLRRAERHIGHPLPLNPEGRAALKAMADGDGRFLYNLVEEIAGLPADAPLEAGDLARLVQRRAPLYDKAQEGHYNLISALHKSLRGSDADAALYWLARMLAGGEDPIFILRRLARAAVEDVGLADPQALEQALAAWQAYERLGSPEGELAIAQCVIYLATAPKSNAAYAALGEAAAAARATGSLMPPPHILNAPTRLMRDLGYGKGYVYDHATADGFSGQDYFPEGMARRSFYRPGERGFEREIKKRLDYWERLRRQAAGTRE
jgi:putative ATPase